MKIFLSILIFLLQLLGTVVVGFGIWMIWPPLAVIYAGIVAFAYGHLLYLVMESEEAKK